MQRCLQGSPSKPPAPSQVYSISCHILSWSIASPPASKFIQMPLPAGLLVSQTSFHKADQESRQNTDKVCSLMRPRIDAKRTSVSHVHRASSLIPRCRSSARANLRPSPRRPWLTNGREQGNIKAKSRNLDITSRTLRVCIFLLVILPNAKKIGIPDPLNKA